MRVMKRTILQRLDIRNKRPYVREGGRTVGSGKVASIIE